MSKLLVPASISKTTGARQESGLNALIYGVSKAGKTVLATSLVGHDSVVRALHVDIDGSPESVQRNEKLDRATIPSGAEGWDAIEELYLYLHGGQHEYNMLVLDTITTMGAYGLDSVLKANIIRAKRSDSERMAFPSMGDYGVNNRRTIRMVRAFREFSVARGWHVIFIAHEKYEKLETGAMVYRPALSGGAGDVIPGIPSMLARLTQDKTGQRKLQLASGNGVVADYRHEPHVKRTVPPVVDIKDMSGSGAGMDLSDIWTLIQAERTQATV